MIWKKEIYHWQKLETRLHLESLSLSMGATLLLLWFGVRSSSLIWRCDDTVVRILLGIGISRESQKINTVT